MNLIAISKDKMQILTSGQSIYITRLPHQKSEHYITIGNTLIRDDLLYPLGSHVLLQSGDIDYAVIAQVVDITTQFIQLYLIKELKDCKSIAAKLLLSQGEEAR